MTESSDWRSASEPAAVYADRARRFEERAAAHQRRSRRYARTRLTIFVVVAATAWGLHSAGRGDELAIVVVVSVVAFGLLVAGHRRARRRQRRAELMATFNREGVARVERRWSALPAPPAAETAHDYAEDLDLSGEASLLHLIGGACGTGPGRRSLRSWLLEGADARTVALRQEAVAELAGAMDFRDRLAAEARLADDANRELHATDRNSHSFARNFLAWAESEDWLSSRRAFRWLRVAAFALPPLNVASIVLYALNLAPTSLVAWTLLTSALVLAPSWKRTGQEFALAGNSESGIRNYARVLAHLSGSSLNSRLAASIRDRLRGDRRGDSDSGAPAGDEARAAHVEIKSLRGLLDMADLRGSPLFHLPLATVFFWDVHVLAALERWKRRAGRRVRDWLSAIGDAEALAALAALAADNPGWATPELDPAASALHGRDVGHPLLPPAACVGNDVQVGPPGSFLLVTGSNMSGKSTLLRAVGLNAVLARAGAVVCAQSFRLPPVRVVTCMSVKDSLARGESFFMAELRRLKQVVDAAESGDRARTLYLLDEILQGTNSAERRIAARAVVRRLLASGAVGAVTTHDLSLADAEDLAARSVAVHFTESVRKSDDELCFDYRLGPGVAQSTNALRLLEIAGLGDSAKPASTRGRNASRGSS